MQKQPFSLLTRGFKEEFFTFFFTFIIAHFCILTEKNIFHSIEEKAKQLISLLIQALLEELLDLDFEVGMYCGNMNIV